MLEYIPIMVSVTLICVTIVTMFIIKFMERSRFKEPVENTRYSRNCADVLLIEKLKENLNWAKYHGGLNSVAVQILYICTNGTTKRKFIPKGMAVTIFMLDLYSGRIYKVIDTPFAHELVNSFHLPFNNDNILLGEIQCTAMVTIRENERPKSPFDYSPIKLEPKSMRLMSPELINEIRESYYYIALNNMAEHEQHDADDTDSTENLPDKENEEYTYY